MKKTLRKMKDMKGITLIALVITIIVLLILAGVSIATLTGENGILTMANKAKEKTKEAEEKEKNNLNEITDNLYGSKESLYLYNDETGYLFGTKDIIKCNTLSIKPGNKIQYIEFDISELTENDLILYVLDYNNKILDIVNFGRAKEIGKNSFYVGKEFNEEVFLAFSACGTRSSYTQGNTYKNWYSTGLIQSNNLNVTVGDTVSFITNVPDRKYQLAIKIDILKKWNIDGTSENNDSLISKFEKKNNEGYSLLGNWFKFGTYEECCNCGGQSIVFYVEGADNIFVDLQEIVSPSHPDWVMDVAPFFAYSIDGGEFTRVQINSSEKKINIPNTEEHFIWIIIDGMCQNSGLANRNSGWSGVRINNISTNGKMYKAAPKCKQILFVGDSIVEGINTIGTDSTSQSNSAINGFSFKTAIKLGAFPLLQGYGGSTTWSGEDFTRYSYVDAKADNFITTLTPDIIVMEYGYNDNSVITTGTKTKDEFITQYNKLLNLLNEKYSGVPIVCMIPFKQSLANEIRNIANSRDNCYLIETADYNITYSDNSHPDVNGSDEASNRLADDIKKIFKNLIL